MSRASEALADVPPATRSIVALCALVYLYQLLFDPTLSDFTLCPRSVLYEHEYYRLITSVLFHANLMHFGMNAMSTLAIGSMLEKRVGTLMMGTTILWGVILTPAVHVFSSLMLALMGYQTLLLQHSVGFSGVIFQLSVLESNAGPDRARSVFGLFSVSSAMYPWALLVVLQFIMPHISFLGHLSGILVGTLQHHGTLDFLFPSEGRLRELELSDGLGALRRQPGYATVPEGGARGDAPGLRSACLAGLGGATAFVGKVCEAAKVIVFGRGAEANANIQLGEFGAAWGSGDAGAAAIPAAESIEDDEEWVGLPMAIQRSTEEL